MFWFYVIGLAVAICGGAYAAYWSLGLRRALRVRVYSRQALIVGLFSIYGTVLFFMFYLIYFLDPTLFNTPVGILQAVLYLFLPPLTMAWIDSSVRVGRRTDPLLRDPIQWSKARFALWPLLLLSLGTFFIPGAEGVVSFVIIAVSVPAVFMAARWSGDGYYRRSLEWFCVAIAVLVIQNIGFDVFVPGLGTGIVYSSSGFVWSFLANFVITPVLFYCIYMCARSLVPLNRLTL
jgi:hypothetical protein